jgi:two-component system, cell cycle response regulator
VRYDPGPMTLSATRLRILVVDDEEVNVSSLKRILRQHEVHGSTSAPRALELAKQHVFDVAISDQRMPEMTGVELFARLLEVSPWTLRLLLTGFADFPATVDAINKSQIAGYLQKPISPPVVEAAIKQAIDLRRITVENSSLYAELRAKTEQLEQANQRLRLGLDERTAEIQTLNEKLRDAAERDGITSLYNHAAFQKRLAEEFSRAQRYQAPLSLLFCDLDHFKQINDRYGHQTGDEALRLTAQILRGEHLDFSMRPSDFAARYGGDELAVLLPNTAVTEARLVGERLCRVVRGCAQAWARERHLDVHFTASIGVSEFLPTMQKPADLIARADAGTYAAKRKGRDRVEEAPL